MQQLHQDFIFIGEQREEELVIGEQMVIHLIGKEQMDIQGLKEMDH